MRRKQFVEYKTTISEIIRKLKIKETQFVEFWIGQNKFSTDKVKIKILMK